MKSQGERQKNQRATEIKPRHGKHIAQSQEGQRRRIQQQAHVGGERDQQTAEKTRSHSEEIKPARDFRRIIDRLRTVHRGNRFGEHCIEQIRPPQPAKPETFRSIQIGTHQICAAQFRAQQVCIL